MMLSVPQVTAESGASPLATYLTYGITLTLLLTGGILMLVHGLLKLKQVKRHKAYCSLLAERHYCELGQMAEAIGKTPKYVAKDLRNMMAKGWFAQGHLDKQETSFMLGEGLYQQYLLAEKGRQEREQQDAAVHRDPNGAAAVAAEGREWLDKIRHANSLMPEKVITAKLNRLEIVVQKIFQYVEEHTEKLPEIRRFMSYYLPTTVKLVGCYSEYETQPLQLESILAAKKEISETLDVINTAFETLLNDLYEDDMLDISTDISALKTILTQEGLVDADLGEPAMENKGEEIKDE